LITQFEQGDNIVAKNSYDFKVRARNDINDGDYANTITVRAVNAPTAPGSPVLVLDRDQDTATVSW